MALVANACGYVGWSSGGGCEGLAHYDAFTALYINIPAPLPDAQRDGQTAKEEASHAS
jgi:hypothetical protein